MVPDSVPSRHGARYMLTLIDDYTRYSWVYFIATKDDVVNKITTFIDTVVPLYNTKIVEFRSDNGGEFKNARVHQLFTMKGIRQSYTAKYTPEHNGIAERFNRTITNMARSYMLASRLNSEFEPYAYDAANYFRNR